MTTPYPLRRHLAYFVFASAFAGFLPAQTAPEPAASTKPVQNEEVIELSPFVVSSDSENGYVATSSLAGSRINTPLKDIAAQIDVMTPEFLNDVSAVTIEDAIAFSTNNGVNSEQNAGPNGNNDTTRDNGRARGFDTTTSSVDFYQTNLPSDLYNIDRLTIANGPQSILFGLGTAGGVVDVSTKRALMKDRDQIEYRMDNNGSSRATVDFNKQLIPRKLALRVVGLKNDGRTYIDGSYNNQNRIFGALSWKISPETTFRINAERMTQRASLATNYVSMNFVTPWIDAGSPLFDNSKGNAAITATANTTLNKNNNALRVIAYDGSGATPSLYAWSGSGQTKGPHQLTGTVDTRMQSFLDSSVYPMDYEPRVGGRVNVLDGTSVRGALEHQFTRNFFVELGFNYERVRETRGGPFYAAESINIFADPNMYLPGGTNAAPNTTPNPHAGQLYVESFPQGAENWDDTRELRFTTAYEFDFAKRFTNFFRHFGRHKFVTLLSQRQDKTRAQNSRTSIIGDTAFTTGDLLNNSRLLRSRYYLDPANGNYYAGGIPGQANGLTGTWSLTDSRSGEAFQATMFDNPAGRTSATTGLRKDILTYMAAVQSYFFNDRLNLFAGRRIDEFDSYEVDPVYLIRGDRLTAGDKQGLYTPLSQTSFSSTASDKSRGVTYSYGGVVRVIGGLSLFASKSNNTGLPTRFLNPDNELIQGVFSEGYDYGFRFNLKDDAISLRVNFYKESQHNLIGSGQGVRTASAAIEERLRGTDKPAGIADVPADGYDPVTRGDVYRSVEDKTTRGIDVTLVANITSNWDLRLAVGKQRTRVFNKSADFTAWADRRLPVWEDFGGLGWDNVSISSTDTRSVHQYYLDEVKTVIVSDKLRDNLPRFRQREWRASLFTNYRFRQGLLKGFKVGGGARWLDKQVAGYVQIPYPDGTTGDDVTQPIMGDDILQFDALAAYSRRVTLVGHKVNWNLQLNVRNVFNNDDPEILRTRNDGIVLQYGRTQPRQVIVSTSLEF